MWNMPKIAINKQNSKKKKEEIVAKEICTTSEANKVQRHLWHMKQIKSAKCPKTQNKNPMQMTPTKQTGRGDSPSFDKFAWNDFN